MSEYRYVSCVPGKLATRFGTGTYIGAAIDPVTAVAVFDANEVVAIPLAEWVLYVREYNRLMRNGDLVQRTEPQYAAWLAEQAEEPPPVVEEPPVEDPPEEPPAEEEPEE